MNIMEVYVPQLWEDARNPDMSQITTRINKLQSQLSASMEDQITTTGGQITGTLAVTGENASTIINHNGVLCSNGEHFIALTPDGPSISLRQQSSNPATSGVKITNTNGDKDCQMQFENDQNFSVRILNDNQRPGNKICSINNTRITDIQDPIQSQDVSNKNYVDSSRPKPVISVWGEEKGRLVNGNYQFAFGNGSASRVCGFPIPTPGRIIAGSLTAVAGVSTVGAVTVGVVKNGIPQDQYDIVKANNLWSGYIKFTTPLELISGDRITFRSKTTNEDVTLCIVAVLIELDII